MSEAFPAIRASHAKSNLSSLSRLGADAERRVRAAIRPDTLDAIEGASRVEWLPVELDVEVTEAIERALGAEACRQWAREGLRISMETPLLRPVVDGVVRLFGLSPEHLFRVVPRGIGQVYRSVGEMRFISRGPGEVALVWERLAAPVVPSVPFFDGTAGAFEAVFDITKRSGSVTLEEHDVDARRVTFRCCWET